MRAEWVFSSGYRHMLLFCPVSTQEEEQRFVRSMWNGISTIAGERTPKLVISALFFGLPHVLGRRDNAKALRISSKGGRQRACGHAHLKAMLCGQQSFCPGQRKQLVSASRPCTSHADLPSESLGRRGTSRLNIMTHAECLLQWRRQRLIKARACRQDKRFIRILRAWKKLCVRAAVNEGSRKEYGLSDEAGR